MGEKNHYLDCIELFPCMTFSLITYLFMHEKNMLFLISFHKFIPKTLFWNVVFRIQNIIQLSTYSWASCLCHCKRLPSLSRADNKSEPVSLIKSG